MKTRVVIIVMLAGILLLATTQVFPHNFLDAPHNSSLMSTASWTSHATVNKCENCHLIAQVGFQRPSGFATDDVCTSCHTDTLSTDPKFTPFVIPAPAVQTHNSLPT